MRIHLLLVMLASCGPHVAPRAQNAQNAVDRAAFAAQRELASARADNDAVKILCERDKAAQIEAIRKSRAERRDEPRVVAALDAKAD
ncbi:MAG TPA: hypothetical protein VN603_10225, partial [Candidatus Acidoferrales bacterium]|nr:hypothetical protein [Candidatus Acidoferrales bacterium]